MAKSDGKLKLAFLDVDGTLTAERDPYMYLNRRLGTMEQMQPHLEMFERGQIDYDEWGQLDAQLWAGREAAHVRRLLAEIPWTPGAHEVIAFLRRVGARIALVSSGLDLHVKRIAAEIKADFAFANELCVEDGRLTGELRVLVPEWGKGDIVERVLAESGVPAAECLAVGDGPSDVKMFERVAWSAAVAPTYPDVGEAASLTSEDQDLRPLVSWLEERW
jgi:phosphoserine phosphatase